MALFWGARWEGESYGNEKSKLIAYEKVEVNYDLLKEGVVSFALKTTITYHRPTRGELRGISTLSPEEQTRIRDELTHTGRASFPISTRVLEESGLLVAMLEAQWGLRKPRTKA
jgi:hypothetical protein